TSQSTPTYFWFCATTVKIQAGKQSILNTAMLADENGSIVSRYHKMRGVMFGEYVPFAKYLGSLPNYIPVPNMQEGTDPAVAHIDGSGRVLQRGPKKQPAILIAQVQPDGRSPMYHVLGDWPAILCGGGCGVLLLLGIVFHYRDRKAGIATPAVYESERKKPMV